MIAPWLGHSRESISGVLHYAREHTQWTFLPSTRPGYEPSDIESFPDADGIIFEGDPPMVEWIAEAGKPAVNTRSANSPGIGSVIIDHPAVAPMALADLRSRGFREFAVVSGTVPVGPMTVAFCDELRRNHLEPRSMAADIPPGVPNFTDALHRAWGPWLAGLPKPIAIFCVSAVAARDVLYAANRQGLNVPEEIAIMALGPDDIVYEMCSPPISYIDGGAHRRGWEAAALLDRMLQGEPPPTEPVRVRPRGIITQRSTDILAIADPELAEAVRIVRSRACEPVSATEILRELPVSRRKIEMGFRSQLGRSIHDEIIRLRIERVKELLAYTRLTMPEIAERCGFVYASHLSRIFRQQVGQSPSGYRREVSAKGG